jgi:hypothetical protein
MRASRRAASAAVAAAIAVLALAPALAAADPGPNVVFSIQPLEIDESSSLVVSSTHPGLVYTANDSGDSATVYVLDDRTGELVGSTSIEGVDPLDIEAMTLDGSGGLIVADIGDNNAERSHTTVYRIDEPDVGTHTVSAEAVRVTYAKGPRNAEAVLYNPDSGRLYIVSKELSAAHVYRSAPSFFDRQHAVMHAVAPAPAIATDAALLPGGDVAVIRTYFSAYFYTFPGWHELGQRSLPNQRQGESIAALRRPGLLWIGSEGEHSRVIEVKVPDLTPPTTTPPTTATPPTATQSSAGPSPGAVRAQNEHREQLKSRAVLIGAGALVLLGLAVAIIAVRWHRHPRVD